MGYFGSKATSGLCQPLIAMMPPHDTYIETHLGGGAIMRRKPAALHNIGIDRDARALDGFECDYPVELIHGCAHRFLSEYAFEGSGAPLQRPAVRAGQKGSGDAKGTGWEKWSKEHYAQCKSTRQSTMKHGLSSTNLHGR